jgi:hypothetical protein
MKKLFLQIILLLVISFPVFFLSKVLLLKYQQKTYDSAFVDKLRVLQSNSHTRKIVLIGGSSVGWGLSAELIEKALGIKTINLGHHAGFGLIDFQSFLMKNITKDDIIVFSPEWHFYIDPASFDKATLDNLIRYNQEYGVLLGNEDYVFKSYFSEIKLQILEPAIPSPYRYDCLNKNGDVVSQCSMKPTGLKPYTIDTTASTQIDQFPAYFQFLKSNKTIFVFPPTQQQVYNASGNFLNQIENKLRSKNYVVYDHVSDNVYPDSLFFDNEYHLTCDARISRTEKLIAYLRQIYKL